MTSTDWVPADRSNPDSVATAIDSWLRHVSSSPLYRTLARAITTDQRMLGIVARIDNAPPMNLLFAAVKSLVQPGDAVAAWYPHLTETPRSPDELAYQLFREFVVAHEDRIIDIGCSRRTQTNEVGRAAAILPWLAQAATAWGEPVHAVDIGASAGLNLCLDKFSFEYADAAGRRAKLGHGSVVLTCENRGDFEMPTELPVFATRTGLDLHPLDVSHQDDVDWLRALVWPEHRERLARLDDAIQVRRRTPITMIAGDAAQTLVDLDATLPDGPMLVWHTIATYQFSGVQRRTLDEVIADIASRRPVVRVGLEPDAVTSTHRLRVGLSYDNAVDVAIADAHGRWIARP